MLELVHRGKRSLNFISNEIIPTLSEVWAVESWNWKKPALSCYLHWGLHMDPLPSGIIQPSQIQCQAGLLTLLLSVNTNYWLELMPMELETSPVKECCYNFTVYNISKTYKSSNCVALPIIIQSESWQLISRLLNRCLHLKCPCYGSSQVSCRAPLISNTHTHAVYRGLRVRYTELSLRENWLCPLESRTVCI